MDVLDLGSMSHQDPDDSDGSDEQERDEPSHWLAELFRGDVLALSGAALLVVTMLGTFAFGDFLVNAFLYSESNLSAQLVYLPRALAAGVASVLGLMGLRKAVRAEGAAWVKVVAGVAAMVGLLVALGSVALLFAADAAELFSPERFQ